MMEHVPWWACAGIILLVVHHPDFLGIDHGFDFGFDFQRIDDYKSVQVHAHRQIQRQLRAEEASRALSDPDDTSKESSKGAHKGGDTSKDELGTGARTSKNASEELHTQMDKVLKIPDFNVSVPCVKLPFVGFLAKPCGNITIGPNGQDIKTLFGTKHIPGTNVVKPYVKEFEKSFEHYTVYLVGGVAGLYVLMTLLVPSKREQFIQKVKDTLQGKMSGDPDPDEDPDEVEADQKARLDPTSADFIAPGNIYRLLAVLHPGKVGIGQWSKWAFKAVVCAYMQLYLPWKIILTVLSEWQFNGFKSPLWFLAEGGAFATMFVSVGSLCNLFAAKCADNIRVGAEANFYILSHHEDTEAIAAARAQKMNAAGYSALQSAIPPIPHSLVTANEYAWCCISFACNVAMSFLLFGAMFLKIATFTGKISEVAMVAVALYFIFDLDGKVMESDPELRPRYRRAVVKQTQEKAYKPQWLLAAAATSRAMMSMLTPVGLVMIFLFAWKSDRMGIVIGGDPF